jgi:capsular exopolysaccharide synthesis family protein
MAKPMDNPGSLTMRAPIESSVRPEPVVEFARKKSPSYATDAFDEQSSSSVTSTERDFLNLAELPTVSLPRSNNKPLVTVDERYAKDAMEAYKSLRTRLLKSQNSQPVRSVAVTSVGKSEGKTVTVFNLAYCCAQVENFSVLLIDGDLRNRALTRLIGRMPEAGLADVLSGKIACESAIARTDAPNLYVMGAGSSDIPATELYCTEKWSQVVRWGRQHFKMVLVDALSIGEFADFELMAPECDGVLVVVRARTTHRETLKLAMEQLDPNKLIGMVWNGEGS